MSKLRSLWQAKVLKTGFIISGSLATALAATSALAHLPSYEGERVRHDNHFTTDGFAQPVRGNCDIRANGPTDPNLGSANIFLGGGNTPPNFFCAFTNQDDWSFEKPIDIIEVTRTPAPDVTTLGLDLEEGYIPCSPESRDPFQCPRMISNPQNGQKFKLPGQCVDLGQPDDPAASQEPDNVFHCALLPGSPRPRTSSVLFSTLTGINDVDWGVYKYQPSYGQQPVVGAPHVPACKETLNRFVTFAYAGPLGMKDARSGKPLFTSVAEAGDLPEEVRRNLPEGYGIRVKRPSKFVPTKDNPRPGYASGYAQNSWLLAPGSVIECIDNFEKCLADTTGELSSHYEYNDIFFVEEEKPVDLYLMWWIDDASETGEDLSKTLFDVSITTGVIDQFLVGDYMNIQTTGPFSGNGRYIHGKCTDPRTDGRANISIETN